MQDTATKWILDKWCEECVRIVLSMTDQRPAIRYEPIASDDDLPIGSDTLILETVFSLHPEPGFWLASPAASTHELGSRTLRAAGIEDAGAEEIQNTCLEILQQCQAGLTQNMTRYLQNSVTSQSSESPVVPSDLDQYRVTVTFPGAEPFFLFIAFTSELAASLMPGAAAAAPNAAAVIAGPAPPGVVHAAVVANSKTFDVLLDVSLPVSVSFGRTEMPVKDVLKLTTGSIVELHRTVSEPVDVIINGCVIARGHVVVLDGNYGVRVSQIVSRQDRLRTGTSAVARAAKIEAAA